MIFWAISTLQISTNISFELVFKVGGTYLFDHITRIRCFGLKKLIWWSIKSRTLSYDMSTMDLMMNSNQWKHKNCIRITWFCVFFNFSCMSIIFVWCSHCFTFTCFSCILQKTFVSINSYKPEAPKSSPCFQLFFLIFFRIGQNIF